VPSLHGIGENWQAYEHGYAHERAAAFSSHHVFRFLVAVHDWFPGVQKFLADKLTNWAFLLLYPLSYPPCERRGWIRTSDRPIICR